MLLLWDNPIEVGVVPGKLFEYLGARRSVLAYGGPGGVVADLLERTRAGRFVHGVSGIKQFLREARKAPEARSPYGGVLAELANYTQREMARQFAVLFDRLNVAKE